MPKSTVFTLICGLFCAAAAQNSDGVPKGAVETSPGVYRVIDKDGKTVMYRKTPFGLQKLTDEPEKADNNHESGSGAQMRKTPFGVQKSPAPDAALDNIKQNSGSSVATPFGEAKTGPKIQTLVTEDGENVRFERPTPFGVTRWARKKSELTAEEKKLWESRTSAPSRADAK